MCRARDGLYYIICQKYRKIVEFIELGKWEEILNIKPCVESRSLSWRIIHRHPFIEDMLQAINHITPLYPSLLLWDMLRISRGTDAFLFLIRHAIPDMVCGRGILLSLCYDELNEFFPLVVDTLLDFGICIDLQDIERNTVLHNLARLKNYVGYCYLVDKGADEDLPNGDGYSAKELLTKMNSI